MHNFMFQKCFIGFNINYNLYFICNYNICNNTKPNIMLLKSSMNYVILNMFFNKMLIHIIHEGYEKKTRKVIYLQSIMHNGILVLYIF